ncbi:MAG: hypothetical protein KC445_21975, partial [Anaerolineales bacterium]|nr:hypothetical protein [Anaerolineales bacterium]
MSERILQIAHHLEIPKEFIMEINERPDESTVVLLNNYQKFTITHAQLTYAQQQLDAQDETNDEPNNP